MPIILFTDSEETEKPIDAESDKDMPKSVISLGLVKLLRTRETACSQTTIKGSSSKAFTVRSFVDLRWHKKLCDKSYLERFYVVDSRDLFVVLGRDTFVQDQGSMIKTLGLERQTDGKVAGF